MALPYKAPTRGEGTLPSALMWPSSMPHQRVYQNHLMGTQTGNLRAQLVAGGICADLESAKRYVQESLAVQVLKAEKAEERIWLEHFVLGVLRPRYCD
jgi:hypothetical protein